MVVADSRRCTGGENVDIRGKHSSKGTQIDLQDSSGGKGGD